MAKNKSTVYLGYDDEEITPKHAALVNSNVNKLGGVADWPNGDVKIPSCSLCGQARALIVQMYAPLENSQFHRSLYLFACLHPVCSQNSKSWLCVRTQHLDTPSHEELIHAVSAASGAKSKKKTSAKSQKINWCSGADDWGEETSVVAMEKMDTEPDESPSSPKEENGNVTAVENIKLFNEAAASSLPLADEDDDDDDSHSMENDLICGFGQLDMYSPQSAEDPNANCAAVAEIAAGIAKDKPSTIYAEIEGPNETDVVIVETPQKPERDLIALLKHVPNPAASGPLAKITDFTLRPYFIAVDLEQKGDSAEHYDGNLSADHIRDLYQEYKRQDEAALSPSSAAAAAGGAAAGAVGGAEEQEFYEKALPAHGDLIFHQFVSTLQQNPGQILRYSRDTLPLLIAPLTESLPKCQNCDGDTICEVQILSTIIPKLKLLQNNEAAPIEFGNVLIFTCLKSCWDTPDKMRYERVIVQNEK